MAGRIPANPSCSATYTRQDEGLQACMHAQRKAFRDSADGNNFASLQRKVKWEKAKHAASTKGKREKRHAIYIPICRIRVTVEGLCLICIEKSC